ncbi:RidA family protein [Bordetella sp. BOR01]|uniref:RidA family protein n=1 Tax=Bordetella sp. BOR01 TaxID=2854779 RepID=UPI001C46C6ED|nr:RidA family protein [Bordetella sp. BOR01]MBV7485389.1 RidA family protein [Bordetella sp. BOR01]
MQHDATAASAPRRQPHFSMIRRAGELVFVSGQMAFGEGFRIVGDDVAAQTRTCLDNIVRQLSAAGLGAGDIVKTTIWLTRVEDFAAFDAAYGAFFGNIVLPARSTVRADLMVPGALVEIEAVACHAGAQS